MTLNSIKVYTFGFLLKFESKFCEQELAEVLEWPYVRQSKHKGTITSRCVSTRMKQQMAGSTEQF